MSFRITIRDPASRGVHTFELSRALLEEFERRNAIISEFRTQKVVEVAIWWKLAEGHSVVAMAHCLSTCLNCRTRTGDALLVVKGQCLVALEVGTKVVATGESFRSLARTNFTSGPRRTPILRCRHAQHLQDFVLKSSAVGGNYTSSQQRPLKEQRVNFKHKSTLSKASAGVALRYR